MSHDYHHDLYDSLHDSPMQRKFRRLAPMPYGVVFLPWKGMTEADMRREYRTMRELGFTNLKQTMPVPGWPTEKILSVALEEGIIPFWYGEGGWEDITPELLRRTGLPEDTPIDEALAHPKMWEYQTQVLRRRIGYEPIRTAKIEGEVLEAAGLETWEGETLRLHNDPILRPDAYPLFKQWARETYRTIESLRSAWNQDQVGICDDPYQSWDDFEADPELSRHSHREYRFIRDVLRFKADINIMRIRRRMEIARDRDPHEPQRAGGEMGLFLPFSWRGTDMEGIAEEMREVGSFYPSIHFAWHFEEVSFEAARCIYMQASIAADWFKGGWSATWESTGGPQQFSGGKGWDIWSERKIPGFTTNAGTMTQLLLSYLAGGFRGAGLWCWNFRRAGWEAGEYALCNRQGQPSPRAIRAGSIAKAAKRLRREIWAAHKEPDVGVLIDWDNEAYWAAISVPNRESFKHYPVHARIGVSRALINGNVPWEHVTISDLRNGLAPRYRSIYMPAHVSIPTDVLQVLAEYARSGGRVVIDAPGGWFDEYGVVLPVGKGSAFEELFGVEIADFQYSNNVPRHLDDVKLDGFVTELSPTTATPIRYFQTGEPAVTENRLGSGSAIVIGFEASRLCFAPGNKFVERALVSTILGPMAPPYSCDDAIVYRLASSDADHYFFINDNPQRRVHLDTRAYRYTAVTDPVSGESLVPGAPIDLEAYSGRWLRYEKERAR